MGAGYLYSSTRPAAVCFTVSGLRQFLKMNRTLGSRFLRGLVLRNEIAAYIAAHEAAGKRFDTQCQELRYEDGIYLLLMKSQGIWYITDIWSEEAPVQFTPVFFWKRLKQGWKEFLACVLIGWCNRAAASMATALSSGEGGVASEW
jgi:hypothetical protein